MSNVDKIKELEIYVRENVPYKRIIDDSPKGYFDHVWGVRDYAKRLAEEYDVDEFLIEVAALLHDIGTDAGEDHAAESVIIAKKKLANYDLSKSLVKRILSCIKNHSAGSEVNSLEEQILQDADGIFFLEDTYKYYFQFARQKSPSDIAKSNALDKVQRMRQKVHTKMGIEMAEKRLVGALKYIKDLKE